ncbi:MAG: high-affinity branched-chain amino acid ABC transporter permease LivM [Arenicella sp.]
MKQTHYTDAFLAAILTLVLTTPIIGLHVVVEGLNIKLEGNFLPVVIAAFVVFMVRLFLHPILQTTAQLKSNVVDKVSLATFGAKQQRVIVIVILLIAVILPFLVSRGEIDLAIRVLIYIILGLGLNVVVGFAGLLDLGYVAFYAVGAYTYALLSAYFGFSFWLCLPIAVVFAAILGFLLGFPVLRLRGDYLAIVTLGFGEIIRLLLNNLDSITGGPDGITGIAKPTFFGLEFKRRATEGHMTFHDFFGFDYNTTHKLIFLYLVALVLVLLTLFVINRLIRMPIGRAWEALREDEIACRSLGLNPTVIKLSAFTIGASFAGFAGCFFAAYQGSVVPESFVFMESVIILAIVVLGGMGSQLGVILAAIALTLLPEFAREFSEYRMLIFGVVMVLMMMWRPQGLIVAKRPAIKLPTASA